MISMDSKAILIRIPTDMQDNLKKRVLEKKLGMKHILQAFCELYTKQSLSKEEVKLISALESRAREIAEESKKK